MKKGEMSITVIIGIIIILFVAVIIIYSLSTGFNYFNTKICLFGNCYTNTDSIQNKCKLMCLDNDQEFCTKELTLKLNEEIQVSGTCDELSYHKFDGFDIEKCPDLCPSLNK